MDENNSPVVAVCSPVVSTFVLTDAKLTDGLGVGANSKADGVVMAAGLKGEREDAPVGDGERERGLPL